MSEPFWFYTLCTDPFLFARVDFHMNTQWSLLWKWLFTNLKHSHQTDIIYVAQNIKDENYDTNTARIYGALIGRLRGGVEHQIALTRWYQKAGRVIIIIINSLSNLNLFNLKTSIFQSFLILLGKPSNKKKKLIQSVFKLKCYPCNSKFTLRNLVS